MDVLDDPLEGCANVGPFEIQDGGLAPRHRTCQPCPSLGNRGIRLQAAILELEAAGVFQAGLVDALLTFVDSGLAILGRDLAQQVARCDLVAPLDGTGDHAAACLGANLDGALVLRPTPKGQQFRSLAGMDRPCPHGSWRLWVQRLGRTLVGLGQRGVFGNPVLGGQETRQEPDTDGHGDDQAVM